MVPSCTKADTLSDLVTEVVQAQPRAAAAKIGRILFISIAFVSGISPSTIGGLSFSVTRCKSEYREFQRNIPDPDIAAELEGRDSVTINDIFREKPDPGMFPLIRTVCPDLSDHIELSCRYPVCL